MNAHICHCFRVIILTIIVVALKIERFGALVASPSKISASSESARQSQFECGKLFQ